MPRAYNMSAEALEARRLGGIARQAAMTPPERTDFAESGADARWNGGKQAKALRKRIKPASGGRAASPSHTSDPQHVSDTAAD